MSSSEEVGVVVGIFVPEDPTVSSAASVAPIRQAVTKRGWSVMEFTAADLESNKLNEVTAFILPGGEPQKMKHALTRIACSALHDWTRKQRGGLIGICAGSVVACGKGRKGTGLVDGICLVDDNRFGSTGLSSMVGLELKVQELPRDIQTRLCEVENVEPEWKMPYVSGPLFALEEKKGKDDSTVSIWATYATDAVEDLLATDASEAENAGAWKCSLCAKVHRSKAKACCRMKKREHKKQWKNLGQLSGVMPGKGAVVAMDTATGDVESGFRGVLFGPHPEMGDSFCVDLLTACIEWVSQPKSQDRPE